MANNIIFTDGFDAYTTILDKWDVSQLLSARGNFTGSAPSIVPGSGRGGAGALFIGALTSSFADYVFSYVQKNVGVQTTMYVGFAFYWNPSGQTGDTEMIRFYDGASPQISLMISPTGFFYFTRGGTAGTSGSGSNGTTIGTSTSAAYPANSFHYLELQVTISSTVGVASLKIDQVAALTQTGLNTQSTANASFSAIRFGTMTDTGVNTYSCYIDDVYFDTLGYNGDVRINGQLPSGNGTTQNYTNVVPTWVAATITPVGTMLLDSNSNLQRCTANTGDFKTGASTAPTWSTTIGVTTTDNHVTWTCLGASSQYKLLNETNPDGDYGYISSNTVGDISRFTFPAIAGSAIKTVMIWAFAKKDDGGARSIRGAIKSGAVVADTGTDVPLGGGYQYLLMQAATDPNTSAAWTVAAVNAAEFGIKTTV